MVQEFNVSGTEVLIVIVNLFNISMFYCLRAIQWKMCVRFYMRRMLSDALYDICNSIRNV